MSETKWVCPTYPPQKIIVGTAPDGASLFLSTDGYAVTLRSSMSEARKAGNQERYQALRAKYLAHVGL